MQLHHFVAISRSLQDRQSKKDYMYQSAVKNLIVNLSHVRICVLHDAYCLHPFVIFLLHLKGVLELRHDYYYYTASSYVFCFKRLKIVANNFCALGAFMYFVHQTCFVLLLFVGV